MLYAVSFAAVVGSTVEDFEPISYGSRLAHFLSLDTDSIMVTVRPASVLVEAYITVGQDLGAAEAVARALETTSTSGLSDALSVMVESFETPVVLATRVLSPPAPPSAPEARGLLDAIREMVEAFSAVLVSALLLCVCWCVFQWRNSKRARRQVGLHGRQLGRREKDKYPTRCERHHDEKSVVAEEVADPIFEDEVSINSYGRVIPQPPPIPATRNSWMVNRRSSRGFNLVSALPTEAGDDKAEDSEAAWQRYTDSHGRSYWSNGTESAWDSPYPRGRGACSPRRSMDSDPNALASQGLCQLTL
jgi:hypothetical protein